MNGKKQAAIGAALLGGLMLLVTFVPTVSAVANNFSSRVLLGDDDFVPSLTLEDVGICRIDFGSTGTITDDTFYLDLDTTGNVAVYDIRLNAFGSNAAGSLVSDSDIAEKGQATDCATADETTLEWADVDSNGDLTDADNAFLCANAGAAAAQANVIAAAHTSATDWDACIRLQASGGKQPGTLVVGGDSDLVNFPTTTAVGTDGDDIFGFFDKDGSGATMNDADWAYLGTAAVTTGSTPDLYAIRLLHGSMSVFSRVMLGDDDFVPTLTLEDVGICRIDFGSTGTITDDTFYLDLDTTGNVAVYDIRLNAFGSNAAGSLVGDSDIAEKGQATDCATADETTLEWADIDSNGDLTDDDNVFLCANAGAAAAQANVIAAAHTSATDWDACIRFQASGGKQPGTLVVGGDSDLVNFPTTTAIATDGDDIFGFFDVDGSGATMNDADWGYFGTGAVATGDTPDLYGIRVLHGSEPFASRVLLGDNDFVPTLMQADVGVCRIDFGSSGTITDDTFYLTVQISGTDGARTDVDVFSIRLNAFGSKEPGTMVLDSDVAEKGQATDCADEEETSLEWADIDSNGDLTEADNVFVCANAGGAAVQTNVIAAAHTSATDWDACIRLQASGGKQPGTLVVGGDSDLVNFPTTTAIATDGDDIFGFFDVDGSGTTMNENDWGYFGTGAVATGDRPDLYGVRVFRPGTVGEGGGGGATTTPTTATTTATTTGGTGGTTTTATTTTTGGTGGTSETINTGQSETRTPGFGFVALVAAAFAAVIVIGRRRTN